MTDGGVRQAVVVLADPAREARARGLAGELARRGHPVALVSPALAAGAAGWQPAEGSGDGGPRAVRHVTLPSDTAARVDEPLTAADLHRLHDGLYGLVADLALHLPVLLVQSDGWAHLVGLVRERTDVPIIADLTGEQAGRARGLLHDASFALAPAQAAAPGLRAVQSRVIVVPDGCASRPPAGPGDVPGRPRLTPPLSRPLVGYCGAGPVDVRLLGALAESHPDWSFPVLADLAPADLQALDAHANVYVLTGVPAAERLAYAAEFDVALAALPDTGPSAERFPVELVELLGAGLPVVSTPHPGALHLQAAGVAMGADPQELGRAVARALAGPHDPAPGLQAARDASWSRSVDRFAPELEALLPTLDVVVTSYESPGPLARCLGSLARDASHPAQVIVVDNASGPQTQAVLDDAEARGVIVERLPANVGFPAAVNHGVARGRGRYVLILNDDVQLPAGGLRAFVHALATEPRAGLVGPTTNRIANEAKVAVPYEERHPPADVVDAVHADRAARHGGRGFDIRVAALFAAIVRRRDFEAVGGLSSRYQLGQFDDDDLSHRFRQELGLRVVCRDDIYVHHAGMTAFGALDPALLDGLFARNRRVFERSTQTRWLPHRTRDAAEPPTMESPMPEAPLPDPPPPNGTPPDDRVAELEAELLTARREHRERLRELTGATAERERPARSVDTGLYELLIGLERERQALHTSLHAEHGARLHAEQAAAALQAERDALLAERDALRLERDDARGWAGTLEQRARTLETSLAWRVGRTLVDAAKRLPGARLAMRLTGRGT